MYRQLSGAQKHIIQALAESLREGLQLKV